MVTRGVCSWRAAFLPLWRTQKSPRCATGTGVTRRCCRRANHPAMQSSSDHESDSELYTFDAFDDVDQDSPSASNASREDDPTSLQEALLSLRTAPCSGIRSAPEPSSAKSRTLKSGIHQKFSTDNVLRIFADATACKTLVISFCSLTDSETTEPEYQWIGTAKRAGATHILCLSDPLQAWYLRRATPSDNLFADCMSIIVREIEQLQPSQVVCIGSSMGGHAAARCGLSLGTMLGPVSSSHVESIVVFAFAPQVFLNPSDRVALRLPWMSFDAALDRLHRAACASKSGFVLDSLVPLATQLVSMGRQCDHDDEEASRRPRVLLEMHVGAKAPSDVREVRLFETAVNMAKGPDASGEIESARSKSSEEIFTVEMHIHETGDERSSHRVAACLHATGYVEERMRHQLTVAPACTRTGE